jgi:Uncharacterized conserved protein (DUF2190)
MPGPASEVLTTITLVAASSVAIYTAVKVDANGLAAVTTGPTDVNVVGVAQNAAAAGEAVTVAISGVTKMVAGGTVAAGARVSATSAGKTVASTTSHMPLGITLTAGTVDKLQSVLLRNGTVLA